ncbi:MAG: ATP-dependent DNA ligase [Anaerolineae bacterium]
MEPTFFAELAHLGQELEQTTKRDEKTALLAAFLRSLAPEEIPPAVRFITGRVFFEWEDRALHLSWRAMMAAIDELVETSPAERDEIGAEAVDGGEFVGLLLERFREQAPCLPPLTILDVFHAFGEIAASSGPGSRARKKILFQGMLARADALEAKTLVRIVVGEMRHGVSDGLMVPGIAKTAGIKVALVRRANQLWGDISEVALVALTQGEAGLRKATVRLFCPIQPMLAQSASSLEEAFERYEDALALEYKLDGARLQIHRRGDEVRLYSRNLADVTASLPDTVSEILGSGAAQEFIADGEVIAVDGEGRPLPFQHLMRRFRRKRDVDATVAEIPVQLHLFDLLYVDGKSLVDAPYRERWPALVAATEGLNLVQRMLPETVEEAEQFGDEARRSGHEGLMAKVLSGKYTPGVRGKTWLKLKHVMSVDLVITAADWGYGRRHGWLSNYHLAALDTETGTYEVVGKTFKGLTDAQFQSMTDRLLSLERSRQRSTVLVEPRIVVEVQFNEIQESSRYRSGLALRFARISRLRPDKTPAQADTLQTLQQLYHRQFKYKGTLDLH